MHTKYHRLLLTSLPKRRFPDSLNEIGSSPMQRIIGDLDNVEKILQMLDAQDNEY